MLYQVGLGGFKSMVDLQMSDEVRLGGDTWFEATCVCCYCKLCHVGLNV